MNQTLQKHATKLRFAMVGGVNTLIDFGVLFLLTNLFAVPKLPANIISTTVAFIFSFFTNKKFTFKKSGNAGLAKELVLFTVVTLFGLWVIQGVIIALLTPAVLTLTSDENLALLVAKLVATAVSMVWNFILYQNLVFKNPSER